MGNVFKKRSSNVLKKSSKPSLTGIPETISNKASEPTILIVSDDEYMNDEMTKRIYSKTENQLDGHRIKGVDFANDDYLFYGGRGGYRPFRRALGNDLTALILCIDSTKKSQASHFSVIGRAISSVSGDKKIPLLIIGVPPNKKSKEAAKKVQQEEIKLAKKRKEQAIKMQMTKKGKNDKKNVNDSVEVPEAEPVVEEIIETEPMNSTEIEAMVTNTLALQTNVLFSTYHIISVPSSENQRSFNDDSILSEGLNWLKGQLNPDSGDAQPPSTAKINVDVKKMNIPMNTSIEGNSNTEIAASA